MEKEFEAATREEAVDLANKWWNAQKGLALLTRYVFAAGDRPAFNEMRRWKVLIHYEKAKSS